MTPGNDPLNLTPQEMFEYRARALALAVQSSPSDVLDTASTFLHFLLNGTPVAVDAPAAPVAPQVRPLPGPGATTAKKPRATAKPASEALVAPPAEPAAPAAAVAAPAVTTPATAAPGAPSTIPPPTTMVEAAESLKALVQSKAPGRGRAVALALLESFGVAQMGQIPPARLAEFKRACDMAGSEGPAQSATDPTGGLL